MSNVYANFTPKGDAMATYRKRGKSWRVEICHRGQRYSKSFPTKQECQTWAIQRSYELEHGASHPAAKKTVKQALDRYAAEEVPKKKGARRELLFIEKMKSYPIADLLLENATTLEWAEWRNTRLCEVKSSSVLREITIIKAMYRVALNEWLWVRSSPLTNLSMPKSPPSRDRRISPSEEQQILEALDFTEIKTPILMKHYVALAFMFALETAMRSSEITNLTWDNVYLNKSYVHLPDSKNGTKRNVPLSNTAKRILSVLPKNNATCFKIDSKQRDSNFRKYRDEKTDILDLTFHDTRHEAITRLAQKIDILDLSRMTGIKNLKTLMVYYNATATEIAKRLNEK